MKYEDRHPVTQIRIGMQKVGIVGLYDALRAADECGEADRASIVAFLMERLSACNYIPAAEASAYEVVVWREYLRRKGEDIRELFEPVDVTVRGLADSERERLQEVLVVALARHELRPRLHFAPWAEDAAGPQLLIGDEVVHEGRLEQRSVERALRRTLSHW